MLIILIPYAVAFKVSDPTKNLSRLTEEFLALKQSVTRDGRPLVVSVKGGQQISTEDIHHDMQVVFIMEFGVSRSPSPSKISRPLLNVYARCP